MKDNKKNLSDYQKLVDIALSNPALSVKYFPPFEMINQAVEELGEMANLHEISLEQALQVKLQKFEKRDVKRFAKKAKK